MNKKRVKEEFSSIMLPLVVSVVVLENSKSQFPTGCGSNCPYLLRRDRYAVQTQGDYFCTIFHERLEISTKHEILRTDGCRSCQEF